MKSCARTAFNGLSDALILCRAGCTTLQVGSHRIDDGLSRGFANIEVHQKRCNGGGLGTDSVDDAGCSRRRNAAVGGQFL